MRKLLLIPIFTAYYIFFPFVLVNCASADLPYALEPDESVSDESKLAECEAQTVLTADCVTILQQAEEEQNSAGEAVSEAFDQLPEFTSCQSFVTPEEGETATVDCAGVVSSVLDAFDVCGAGSSDDDFACDEISNRVQDSADKCDMNDPAVTEDFCSLLG